MYQEISDLFMYGDLDKDSILYKIGEIIREFESTDYDQTILKRKIKTELKRLLALATDYGFDKNLWHNYIAFFVMMNENPFSLVCEKNRIGKGTVNQIVKEDFSLIRKIFFYDFSTLEKEIGINSFSLITNYQAIKKNKSIYNWNVSQKVQKLSAELEEYPSITYALFNSFPLESYAIIVAFLIVF